MRVRYWLSVGTILTLNTVWFLSASYSAFARVSAFTALCPQKNSKGRTIKPATAVMDLLKRQKAIQAEMRLKAGTAWENDDFVFTNECGHHFDNSTIYRAFKKAATAIGRPDARFHDLRHSYAVAAIQSGDDIKTVQSNLGHATAAFTLDVYGHVTEQMKQASSERMDNFIKSVSGGEK